MQKKSVDIWISQIYTRIKKIAAGYYSFPLIFGSSAIHRAEFYILSICIACMQCLWCGLLLQMSHVAWSVCLSVCVLGTQICCTKTAEPIVGLFGGLTRESKKSCIKWGSRSDESICCREGWQDGDATSCHITLDTCYLILIAVNIRSATSLSVFRRWLKTHLFDIASNCWLCKVTEVSRNSYHYPIRRGICGCGSHMGRDIKITWVLLTSNFTGRRQHPSNAVLKLVLFNRGFAEYM